MITDTVNVKKILTYKAPMLKGVCVKCKKIKTQFTSNNSNNKKLKAVKKKKGGFIAIPAIASALAALGSLAGGASAVAKTINAKKAAQKQLEEARRHNLQMEKKTNGKGLFLKPGPRQRKTGEGLYLKPFKK
jgi:hypothetical protein